MPSPWLPLKTVQMIWKFLAWCFVGRSERFLEEKKKLIEERYWVSDSVRGTEDKMSHCRATRASLRDQQVRLRDGASLETYGSFAIGKGQGCPHPRQRNTIQKITVIMIMTWHAHWPPLFVIYQHPLSGIRLYTIMCLWNTWHTGLKVKRTKWNDVWIYKGALVVCIKKYTYMCPILLIHYLFIHSFILSFFRTFSIFLNATLLSRLTVLRFGFCFRLGWGCRDSKTISWHFWRDVINKGMLQKKKKRSKKLLRTKISQGR